MESKELRIGRAGQYLAMFDLLSKGYKAFETAEGVNYDIVVDVGQRLLRLQVKTTQRPGRINSEYQNPTYLFHVRRAGKGGKRFYETHEFDGLALACLDTRSVWYVPFTDQIRRTLIFRIPGVQYNETNGRRAPYIDEFTSEKFFESFPSPT